jgi:hypothetical protein
LKVERVQQQSQLTFEKQSHTRRLHYCKLSFEHNARKRILKNSLPHGFFCVTGAEVGMLGKQRPSVAILVVGLLFAEDGSAGEVGLPFDVVENQVKDPRVVLPRLVKRLQLGFVGDRLDEPSAQEYHYGHYYVISYHLIQTLYYSFDQFITGFTALNW